MSRFVLGEFTRSLDERYRISIPVELSDSLQTAADSKCILAKERPGALSLWHADDWGQKLDKDVSLIRSKIEAGHLKHRITEVQLLGRLLSTRHRDVQIAGRGRLNIPDGFRDFLGIEPGGNAIVIGAAVCIEIWQPSAWINYLNDQIPQFGRLVEELAS
jgi:MraZ protein